MFIRLAIVKSIRVGVGGNKKSWLIVANIGTKLGFELTSPMVIANMCQEMIALCISALAVCIFYNIN